MSSKGRPHRTITVEGFSILVGKSSIANDDLSLRIAKPEDEWLHAGGGCPGSHVVVQNTTGQPLPRSVLLKAGQLAAWYSKARGQPRVEVHYCLAKNVSKRRGAPAGEVHIQNFKKLYVVPTAVESDSEPPKTEANC